MFTLSRFRGLIYGNWADFDDYRQFVNIAEIKRLTDWKGFHDDIWYVKYCLDLYDYTWYVNIE